MAISKNQDVIKFHKEGKTLDEIIALTNKTDQQVRSALRYFGYSIKKKVNKVIAVRNEEILSIFKTGATYLEIATRYKISGERVRQIIDNFKKKTSLSGGIEIRRVILERKRKEKNKIDLQKKKSYIRKKYGISLDEFKAICNQYGNSSGSASPFKKFNSHKANSIKRGIPFLFSFSEWFDAWIKSGKFEQRGRGFGYVMARYGDVGPYSKDNVYICTAAQNTADQYKSGKERKDSIRHIDGLCKRGHVFNKQRTRLNGKTYRVCSICLNISNQKWRKSKS